MLKSTEHTTGVAEVLREVKQDLQASDAVLITTLPRGGLQILRTTELDEGLVRLYNRDFHAMDRTSWAALAAGEPRRLDNSSDLDSRFRDGFLRLASYEFEAAVPVEDVLIAGYPGLLTVFRNGQQADFSQEDLEKLRDMGRRLEDAARHERDARIEYEAAEYPLKHQPRLRQFIFDRNGNELGQSDAVDAAQRALRENIKQAAVDYLEHHGDTATTPGDHQPVLGDRMLLPDEHGDQWFLRAVAYKKYPALTDGPLVFMSIQPECEQWGALRPDDFEADGEVSRLVPALNFMADHYKEGPSLNEIAGTVDLSPFHFHRRFTELLGITPKHMLFDCQISEAKRQLVEPGRELADIASDCGFAHQSHFTSRFKQATGLTPTRWRRLALEQASKS
ncbi:MAG: helix-turn-helix domain-containing protein [Phycisphaerae bacterium]